MPFSLFQPPFNASLLEQSHRFNVIPSNFPAPIVPDVCECNKWYAKPEPATAEDCRIAWDLLPSGNAGQPFSYHFNDDDPNRLPIEVSHGTCQIIFTTSGESATNKDPIIINPTDIRNMAGWVIDQCVSGEREGGAITKDLKHATDWILDPNSDFYDAAMPDDTTYLSLYVWNWTPSQDIWNAGDNDPSIGYGIQSYIDRMVDRMPEGDDKYTIDGRADHLGNWVSRMEFGTHQVWWEPPHRPLQSSNSS